MSLPLGIIFTGFPSDWVFLSKPSWQPSLYLCGSLAFLSLCKQQTNPGIELASLALANRFFTTKPPGKPINFSHSCFSVTKACLTLCSLWTAAHQTSLSFIICRSLFKVMSIKSVMPYNHLIFCHPLPLLSSQEGCWESLPASGSFPVSRRFPSGGQSIGASASASVLPMNIQGWFHLGLTGLISLQSKGLSRVFPRTTIWKHQFFGA